MEGGFISPLLMPPKQPYDYQETIIKQSAQALYSGLNKVLVQAPTGAGKTVIFSFISYRFIQKSTQDVIIFVHRKELLKQTRDTIFEVFGISAQPITAGMKHVPKARIYIAMIESAKNRMPSNLGLAILDECHQASLHKAHTFAEGIRILGFSATPISANKKVPLNGIYQTLIPGPQISTLIARGKLCQNITIAPKNIVDRNKLAVKGGEFNETIMGQEFSKGKHVKNTLKYYRKLIDGKKTLIFNCNISHSIEVTREFVAAGINCRHLDSENCTDFERSEILTWLKHTPNAVLSSVGILTTGFDEPSIEAIVVNRSIMSVALWLQITGRGGRSHPGKEIFYVIDMGGNAVNLGDWSDDRNWVEIFNNPPSPSKNAGIAPCKSCPQCDAIIAANAMECKFCGYKYTAAKPSKEEEVSEEYTILTKGIDISKYMERGVKLGHKQYASFYEIGKRIVKNAPSGTSKSTLIQTFTAEGKKWCQLNGKSWNAFHRKLVEDFVTASSEAAQGVAEVSPTQQHASLTKLQPLTSLPSWL